MAYLINRNPCGRIICLHALTKYLHNKFGDNSFALNDFKYDENSTHNIHQTCELLIKHPSILKPVCPFLENPLSLAKCYLTQSIQEDKQKSKSVSDAFNALEGLGFVERVDSTGILTENGKKFSSTSFFDEDMLPILKAGLLSYGPFVGLINEFTRSSSLVSKSDIRLGYPNTIDKVFHQKQLIRLSTGSQEDTITRTRSTLFIWAISGGFALPYKMPVPTNKKLWHTEVLPYIKSKKWSARKFKSFVDKDFFNNKIFVDNPLTYESMTKSTKALRERNQELERSITLKFEPIVKNRRFALIYLLAKASTDNKNLDISKTIFLLKKYPDLFVVNSKDFDTVMISELEIATVTGIPYSFKKNVLSPLTKINIKKASQGAPPKLLSTLNKIYPGTTI